MARTKPKLLEGSNALITGGSGIIGSGVVRSYLLDGATVIAPVRSEADKAALLAELHDVGKEHRLSQLHVLVMGEFVSQEGMQHLAREVLKLVPILDHIVSCFGGGFPSGPCSSLAPEDVLQVVGDRATPHLLLAQALFPLLSNSPRSSFTFITGMLGERCSMPDASALTISNAALYGIIPALEAEHEDTLHRINEVSLSTCIYGF